LNALGIDKKVFGDFIDTTKISRIHAIWFKGERCSIELQITIDGKDIFLIPTDEHESYNEIIAHWESFDMNNLAAYDWSVWKEKR